MASETGNVLGVIAGAGEFPTMVVRGAQRAGCRVVVIGLRGLADPSLVQAADTFRWSGLARLGRWISILSKHGVRRVIMAGYVHKRVMYGRFRLLKVLPDWTSFKLWFLELRDKRNDAVLGAVADVLQAKGITLENCVQYCPEAMAQAGVLTGGDPNPKQSNDIEFGWRIAKELGRLDIGQAVAVKETEVIAVEAIEGTDRMIDRAGELCKHGGWTLVKVAKPDQDMRFDVPTIGPDTIERLHKRGAKLLVIEAEKTLIINRETTVRLAKTHGITIIAKAP
jgi:UDP-2,3-diacylglucosamine hydrolase